jgi:hypothetical protein
LLVLGGLLLAVVGVQQVVSNWHYVLSGAPGTLLYAATFDDFGDEWQQYTGRLEAQLVGGRLQLKIDDVKSVPYSVAKPYFGDFDVRVEGRALAGPLNNGYGITFRLQDPDNQYLFLVSSDGYYSVRRKVNGVERELSTWIDSPVVHQDNDRLMGSANRLRVVAQKDRFQFYVNDQRVKLCVPDDPSGVSTYSEGTCVQGKMVDTLVDDSLSVGHLGVAAQSFDDPGVVVDFDNFVVAAPQPIEG